MTYSPYFCFVRLKFYKYQGTGNDFILFDNRRGVISGDQSVWFARLCDRRFGIGADGVMLLQEHPTVDFEMVYFNADGCESSMCGNGGRCMVQFAARIGMKQDRYHFLAVDGMHEAEVKGDIVHLKMNDVHSVISMANYYQLDTGSPHYVVFMDGIKQLDIKKEGAAIRYSETFKAEGINVNFVELSDGGVFIRTYERGVEDETLSCGTGVTAAALATAIKKNLPAGHHEILLHTMGGELRVQFEKGDDGSFKNIWLIGPGEFVFEGEVEEVRNAE